jgi:D-glycero-D-manno-heptose 1,7-bisphosphate phosphatase
MGSSGPVLIRWSTRSRAISRSVLADRDGVLVDVLPRPDGGFAVRPSPHAARALAALRDDGYAVVVVTNQSCVSRGAASLDAMLAANETALNLLDPARAAIDHVVICTHAPDDGCGCRKPLTGGVRALERDVGQTVDTGWFIGDQRSDLDCGRALGVRTALVATGHGTQTWCDLPAADRHVVDLRAESFADAVRQLLRRHRPAPHR